MFAAKNGIFVVLLAWFGSALSKSDGMQTWKYAQDESEFIIGEMLATQDTAGSIADAIVKEADRIWTSPAWETATTSADYTVEYKNVSGPFADSGLYVTRGRGVVRNAAMSADKLFELLSSPEGYQIIDPISDPADYGVALENFTYQHNTILRAELSEAVSTGPIQFVVLNLLDYNRRLFLSKSIMHDSHPGSSKWGPGTVPPEVPRATNTFGLRLAQNGNDINVEVINWLDLLLPSLITNPINLYSYMQPLYDRIIEAAT